MEIIVNTNFFDGIDKADLKQYIKDLKQERENVRNNINNYIINTIFETGHNLELQIIERNLSKKIMELMNGFLYISNKKHS